MKNNEDGMTEWRCDGWRVTKRRVTSDVAMSDECLEMAEMAEMLVEGLGGMEWDLD